jgi:hypothetical protein
LRSGPGALARLAIDQVEDHIEIGGVVLEALGLVVDDDVGAEGAREVDVVGRDGRQHASAFRLGELHGEMADTAGAAMNQYRLAGLQLAVPEQALPRGLSRERDGGSVDMIQRRRLACDRLLVKDDLLGIAAAVDADHAEDLVADLEGGRLRAALLYGARDVTPEGVGQPVFFYGRVLAAADLEVDGIDARRLDGHQDL